MQQFVSYRPAFVVLSPATLERQLDGPLPRGQVRLLPRVNSALCDPRTKQSFPVCKRRHGEVRATARLALLPVRPGVLLGLSPAEGSVIAPVSLLKTFARPTPRSPDCNFHQSDLDNLKTDETLACDP